MNSSQSPCSQSLESILDSVGVFRFGIAEALPVSALSIEIFRKWIDCGCHAGMKWMENNSELRNDPTLLLPEAKSLIVCVFPYPAPPPQAEGTLRFASYALGDDYHRVIRRRLKKASDLIVEKFGGKNRICVDSAPLRERYWAVRSGLGFIARNCQLVIPGYGSRFFLGTIISTIPFSPTPASNIASCNECGRCVANCPGKALSADGIPTLDSRKCLSYLTIEHQGEFPEGTPLLSNIFGCDICQNVCPLNSVSPQPLSEFQPRPQLLRLTPSSLRQMDESFYSSLFANSAIRRASLTSLLRNLSHQRNLPPT